MIRRIDNRGATTAGTKGTRLPPSLWSSSARQVWHTDMDDDDDDELWVPDAIEPDRNAESGSDVRNSAGKAWYVIVSSLVEVFLAECTEPEPESDPDPDPETLIEADAEARRVVPDNGVSGAAWCSSRYECRRCDSGGDDSG